MVYKKQFYLIMIILQVAADSAAKTITMAGEAAQAPSSGAMVLLSAIIMPLLVLSIFSVVKYTVGVGIEKIDWIDLFAEMAIDLLSIFSSFIIGRFILDTSSSDLLITAFKVIGVMALGVLLLCLLRRYVGKERATSNARIGRIRLYIVAEYGIDALCLFLMFVLNK